MNSVVELLLVSGHVSACPPVDKVDVLDPVGTFCGSGSVHCCIAPAYDRDVLTECHVSVFGLELSEEVKSVNGLTVRKVQGSILVCTYCEDYRVGFEGVNVIDSPAKYEFRPDSLSQPNVILYFLMSNPE